jgi:hypothetical protein
MAILLTVTSIAARRHHRSSPAVGHPLRHGEHHDLVALIIGSLVAIGAAYGGSLVFDYQLNVEDLSGRSGIRPEVDQTHADKAKPIAATQEEQES